MPVEGAKDNAEMESFFGRFAIRARGRCQIPQLVPASPPCPGAFASTLPASCPPEAGKHYVMARGLERRAHFRDDRDRQDVVPRGTSGTW